ncbi:hypothetical protein STANM309S_04927 [Streptomyces tanashiensis]
MIKAGDESANGPKGGPRYEGSEFGYGGETANYPRLVLTFGRQGVDLAAPTTIHDTGAELNWSAYQDKDAVGTGDDIVEYQVHRSVSQTFTPSAATLVAPVAPGTTSFTDTSATPTKADDADPFGRAYYYMVAVRTKDGQVVAAPTQLVRLPKAGRTTKVFAATQDTTLSSAQSTTAHDTIDDSGPKNWLSVGNNSATYGDTRALLKFPALGIPPTARVLDANVRLWSTQTAQDTTGAVYELRPLTRDFDESTATWVKADASTNWTAAGGDFGAVTADTGAMTNDPARHDWNVTSLAQSWVTTPASQKGVVLKMADEAASQERTLFLSSEGTEPKLAPRIVVTYIDSTTESTYYAPQTPARMTPNSDYTVDFTLTNTTASTWNSADHVLTYKWTLPDGTDVTTGGNQVQTALPANVAPGGSVGLQAQVKTPINSDNGNKRTDYVLTWDVYNKTAGTWTSGTSGIPGLQQNVAVEDPTSNTLGLEKFYGYTGKNTGAGASLMNNLGLRQRGVVVQRVQQPRPGSEHVLPGGLQQPGHLRHGLRRGLVHAGVGADPARRAAGVPPQAQPDRDPSSRRRRNHPRVPLELGHELVEGSGRCALQADRQGGSGLHPAEGPGPGRLDDDPSRRKPLPVRL